MERHSATSHIHGKVLVVIAEALAPQSAGCRSATGKVGRRGGLDSGGTAGSHTLCSACPPASLMSVWLRVLEGKKAEQTEFDMLPFHQSVC